MAKQLDTVILCVSGDGDGPTHAVFKYIVSDTGDPALSKNVQYIVDTPMFDVDTVGEFFDGYVSVFKTNEGIV